MRKFLIKEVDEGCLRVCLNNDEFIDEEELKNRIRRVSGAWTSDIALDILIAPAPKPKSEPKPRSGKCFFRNCVNWYEGLLSRCRKNFPMLGYPALPCFELMPEKSEYDQWVDEMPMIIDYEIDTHIKVWFRKMPKR